MRVCDVVLNTIWHDPRVNRQITEYLKRDDIILSCVGLDDGKYDKQKIESYACQIDTVFKPEKYNKKFYSVIKKLIREAKVNNMVCDAIIKQKPDVIHANDLNALVPAMKAAKKLGCRVIYDSHEIYIENLGYNGRKLYKKYLEHIEQRLVKKVDLMVCVSNVAADYFAKKYHIKRPTVVTNSALKQDRAIADTPKSGCFEVLNQGKFYAGRGYELCAAVGPYLKDYPDIKFVIRGLGDYKKVIENTISGTQSGDAVRMDPPVTVQELIPMAAKSHIGVAITEPVCLNFELSVSNKIFEYAAAGLPVIMSDIPEHRYLNDKYHFGIILKENTPKEIAKAAIELYLNQDLYKQCRENALRMSEEMNWETEFESIIKFINNDMV